MVIIQNPAECLFVISFVFRTVVLCFISVVLGGGVSGRWCGWGPVPRF